jgi:hypothetical protein
MDGSASSGGGGGDGGERDASRPVRDMQSLLHLCIRNTEADDGGTNVRNYQMDEERKAWLEEAMKSMSVDVIKEMLENIESIKEQLHTLNSSSR